MTERIYTVEDFEGFVKQVNNRSLNGFEEGFFDVVTQEGEKVKHIGSKGVVHKEKDGAGEKYQNVQYVYAFEALVNGKVETIYISHEYTMSGSYFTEFNIEQQSLSLVEKHVKVVEKISYY